MTIIKIHFWIPPRLIFIHYSLKFLENLHTSLLPFANLIPEQISTQANLIIYERKNLFTASWNQKTVKQEYAT